ncbi:MAG: SprT family zinc-dependent metalloprotease [Deltaproteobacteria bacterium]|nr:SprT family zinc-dependent metalloprotease [Deltaproteobacteria bacterium]
MKWSTRRKTIGLQVTTAGELVIAAPLGTPPETIRQALEASQKWITRKLAQRREALNRIDAGKAYYLGQAYPVCFTAKNRQTVRLIDGKIHLNSSGSADLIWHLLKLWYLQEAEERLTQRVRHYARFMKLRVGPIEMRDWKRRWGECRPAARMLRFNWRLVLLPPYILDYVVAHELTHLAVPGHPPRFWRKLAKVMPDCLERRRWLNRYGSPFLLWKLEVETAAKVPNAAGPLKKMPRCSYKSID